MWVVAGSALKKSRVYALNMSRQSAAVRTYEELQQHDPRTASTQLVAEIVQNVVDWWLGQLQLKMDGPEAYARAARMVRKEEGGSGGFYLTQQQGKPLVALLVRNNHLEIRQYGQGMLDARACLPIGCTSKARADGAGGAHGMGLKQVFAVVAACRQHHPKWALCLEGTLPDGTYASLVPAVISAGDQETYGVRGIRRNRPSLLADWSKDGTPMLVHQLRVWDVAEDPLQLLTRAHVLLRAWPPAPPASSPALGGVLLHTEDVAALALGSCGKDGGALYLNGQFAGPSHLQPLDLLVHVPDPRQWSDINRSGLRREELERHISEQCHKALEREVDAFPAYELDACDLLAHDACVPSERLGALCAAPHALRPHVVALLGTGRSLAVRKAVYLAWPQLAARTRAWLRMPRVREWEVLQFEDSFGKDVWASALHIACPPIIAHDGLDAVLKMSIPADLHAWLTGSTWSAVDDDVHYLGEDHHRESSLDLDAHLLEHMRFPWQPSPLAAESLESGVRALGLLLRCAPYDVRAWEGTRYLAGSQGWRVFPEKRKVAVSPDATFAPRATEAAWACVFEHMARGTLLAALDFDAQVLPFVRHVLREHQAGRTPSHPVRLEMRDLVSPHN